MPPLACLCLYLPELFFLYFWTHWEYFHECTTMEKGRECSLNHELSLEMNTVVALSFCGSRWHVRSIFHKCFCKSCQFVFHCSMPTSSQVAFPWAHEESMRRICSLDTRQVSRWSVQKMSKQMFGLLSLCQLGLRCKVTHRLRSRCWHDIGLVSRSWFKTKWTHYLHIQCQKLLTWYHSD